MQYTQYITSGVLWSI